MIRSEETTIWVPRRAKQFRESGVLKAVCPECGYIGDRLHLQGLPGRDRCRADAGGRMSAPDSVRELSRSRARRVHVRDGGRKHV